MSKFVGIDFSGAIRPWLTSTNKPAVWLAMVQKRGRRLTLTQLIPIQSLEGEGEPFDRLVKFLTAATFEAAAIDAPFSLPVAHMPKGGHPELLCNVRLLSNGPNRPFPLAVSIVAMGEAVTPKIQSKPLRQTEAYWASQGVNTRSTMWAGPRGGAAFTAACLRLLERTNRPCWPWASFQPGILVEAFPAAQLQHWGLPHQGYSLPSAATIRGYILSAVRERVQISESHSDILIGSADALDAVLASFAAIAVAGQTVANYTQSYTDGFIAVSD